MTIDLKDIKGINCSSDPEFGDIKTIEEAFSLIKEIVKNLETLPKFITVHHFTPYHTPGTDEIVLNHVKFPKIICDRVNGNKTENKLRDFFTKEFNITLF